MKGKVRRIGGVAVGLALFAALMVGMGLAGDLTPAYAAGENGVRDVLTPTSPSLGYERK
jgi:hypothetical protein